MSQLLKVTVVEEHSLSLPGSSGLRGDLWPLWDRALSAPCRVTGVVAKLRQPHIWSRLCEAVGWEGACAPAARVVVRFLGARPFRDERRMKYRKVGHFGPVSIVCGASVQLCQAAGRS